MSFESIEENNVKKYHSDSFADYHVPNVEIKDFFVRIDGKSFFDLPVKDEEVYEKTMSISKNKMTVKPVTYSILLILTKITD